MPVQYSSGFIPTSDYYTRLHDINDGLLKVSLQDKSGGGVEAEITIANYVKESDVVTSVIGSFIVDVFTDTFTSAINTTVEKYRYDDGYLLVFIWTDPTNSLSTRRIGKVINITHIYELIDRQYNSVIGLKAVYDTYEFMREDISTYNTTKYVVNKNAFYALKLAENRMEKYDYHKKTIFAYYGTSKLVSLYGGQCHFVVSDEGLSIIYIDTLMNKIYIEYLSEQDVSDYGLDEYSILEYNISFSKQYIVTSDKNAIYLFCNRTIAVDTNPGGTPPANVPFVFAFSHNGRLLYATNLIPTTSLGEYGGPYTFATGYLDTEGLIVSIYDSTYNIATLLFVKKGIFEIVARLENVTAPINRVALFGRQIILSDTSGNLTSILVSGGLTQYVYEHDLLMPPFVSSSSLVYNGIYGNNIELSAIPNPPQNSYLILGLLHNTTTYPQNTSLHVEYIDNNNIIIDNKIIPLNVDKDNSVIILDVPYVHPMATPLSKIRIYLDNGDNILIYAAYLITSTAPKTSLPSGDYRYEYSYMVAKDLVKTDGIVVTMNDRQPLSNTNANKYFIAEINDLPEKYDGYYGIMFTEKGPFLSLQEAGMIRSIDKVGSSTASPPSEIFGINFPRIKPTILSPNKKVSLTFLNPIRNISLIDHASYLTNYYVVPPVGGSVTPGPNDLVFNNRWDSPDGLGFYSTSGSQSYLIGIMNTSGAATFGNTVALLSHKNAFTDIAFIHGTIVIPYSATRTIDDSAKIISVAVGHGDASLVPYDLNTSTEKIFPFFIVVWYPTSDVYAIATPTGEKLYIASGQDIINLGADLSIKFYMSLDLRTKVYNLSMWLSDSNIASYILSDKNSRRYGDLDSFLNDTNVFRRIVDYGSPTVFYYGSGHIYSGGGDLVLAFSAVGDGNNNNIDKSMLLYTPQIHNLSNSAI